MIRISISYFYGVGSTLRPLSSIMAGPVNLWWSTLYSARTTLEGLFSYEWFGPALQTSYGPGSRLLETLVRITNEDFTSYQLTPMDAYAITEALQEFETVMKNELGNADAYYVTRKGGYDTRLLVTNAEKIFPSDLPTKVPEAISDIREAGKCLGYESSTAAAFHVMRALESVLRKYWDAVAAGKPHPRIKTFGNYLRLLNDNKLGDTKVRAVLQQIKDLHRNSVAHPGATLTLDQAIGLFGIAHSAIAATLEAIPMPPPPNALAAALLSGPTP